MNKNFLLKVLVNIYHLCSSYSFFAQNDLKNPHASSSTRTCITNLYHPNCLHIYWFSNPSKTSINTYFSSNYSNSIIKKRNGSWLCKVLPNRKAHENQITHVQHFSRFEKQQIVFIFLSSIIAVKEWQANSLMSLIPLEENAISYLTEIYDG